MPLESVRHEALVLIPLVNIAIVQVVMRLLLDPGETMLCEEYTYPHIAESLVQAQVGMWPGRTLRFRAVMML